MYFTRFTEKSLVVKMQKLEHAKIPRVCSMYRFLLRIVALSLISSLWSAAPAAAQSQRAGQVAGSEVGHVGKRQTRDEKLAGIEPMARIDSRIQNRVQSRIRNRIDRDYDPEANANSPFEVASKQVRTAGQRPR